MKIRLLSLLVLLFLPFSAGAEPLQEAYIPLFAEYFSEKIPSKSVLPVIEGTEEELRSGKIPLLTLCVEDASVEGVLYDRLLLVLKDVLFSVDKGGVRLHSYSGYKLSGSIPGSSFRSTLEKNMPRFTLTELELQGGTVMVKGVYERKMTFTIRALLRLKGKYVIEKDGKATIRFDESTNDNALISAADVGRALAKAAPVLSFSSFFGKPSVTEVRVDHGMIWFSGK